MCLGAKVSEHFYKTGRLAQRKMDEREENIQEAIKHYNSSDEPSIRLTSCNDQGSYRVGRVPIDLHEYSCVNT